jgi:hypothetical protein
VLVSQAKLVLGLVEHRRFATAMDVLVLGSANLVGSRLSARLLAIGDNAARDLVGGVGDAFLDLLAGRLAGVRSEGFLGLIAEIFASQIRHDDG